MLIKKLIATTKNTMDNRICPKDRLKMTKLSKGDATDPSKPKQKFIVTPIAQSRTPSQIE
jgi:hypothetical protein